MTAFASGDIDVVLFGITPSMVLTDRGAEATHEVAESLVELQTPIEVEYDNIQAQ